MFFIDGFEHQRQAALAAFLAAGGAAEKEACPEDIAAFDGCCRARDELDFPRVGWLGEDIDAPGTFKRLALNRHHFGERLLRTIADKGECGGFLQNQSEAAIRSGNGPGGNQQGEDQDGFHGRLIVISRRLGFSRISEICLPAGVSTASV